MPFRRGSAIVMVLAFITVVSVVAAGVSYLSSGRRRVEALSMSDFRAFEAASSAVDYAARTIALEQVFPAAPYRDAPYFLQLIANDDETGLRGVCTGCSEWRPLKDPDGKDAGKIWTAWTFPAAHRVTLKVDPVRELAKKDPGVVDLAPVIAHPLRFRRDLVAGRWQSWGVIRFESAVTCQDPFAKTTLVLDADRMFTLEVTTDATDGHITGAKLVVSAENLRTAVRR